MVIATIDEIMICCMAKQIQDGDIVAQGIATPMVATAYLLAKMTHAPNLYFMSAIGQGVCKTPAPISIMNVEKLWLDRSLTTIGFARAATEGLPTLKPKEFFRPAQVDEYGNFNNIAIGTNYKRPRLRLPGTGGIPDVTTFINDIYLYVPRHSRVTFTNALDYVSGLGHSPKRKYGTGPKYLITDLGQFDFFEGRMRLISTHPGVDIQQIQKKTAFDIIISDNLKETPYPTDEEINLIRNKIDPFESRKLEFLSGGKRREHFRNIISSEMNQ